MRTRFWLVVALLVPLAASASGGGEHLAKMDVQLGNKAALQRGARTFVNYCMSCHGMNYMRFSGLARDLGIPENLVEENLIFTDRGINDTMDVAIDPAEAAAWFGVAPPDLSVIARVRGADWLYAYLKGFYRDDDHQWGVDNLVFPKVSMPHVLVELQGVQERHGDELELVEPGLLSEEAYDQLVSDLVTFMVYAGEPAKLVRYGLGAKVIAFLLVFTLFAWLLKREYWQDVH